MKKLVLVLLCMFAATTMMAQTVDLEKEPKSETLKFLEYGACFKKEFYDIGTIRDLMCQVLIITDIVDNTKMGCVMLGVTSKFATLDYTEIDACIKFLEYIKNVTCDQPAVYTEFLFQTNDDIEIGAFYNEDGNMIIKQGWNISVQISKYVSAPTAYFPVKNIDLFIDLLTNAKNLIAEKIK